MMTRLISLMAVLSLCTTTALAQEASLWSYTGNATGDKGFRIRKSAITTDASRAVTFAQQFGTNSPKKPKFAVWDFSTGKRISAWRGETVSVGLAISHDGTKAASLGLSATDEGPTKIDVWQVASGKHLMQAEVKPRTDVRRTTIRFSKDGKGIFVLGGNVQIVDVASGKVAAVGKKRSFPAADIDWSVSGDRFVWLDPANMYIYAPSEDLARNRPPKRTIGMPYQMTDARLSGDGKTAFVSVMPNDGPRAGHQFLGVWNTVDGKQLQLYDCQWRESEFLRNLHVSHEGRFAAGSRGRRDVLWIYDLKKNVAPDFPRERMVPVGFTPGGVLIVLTPGRPLRFLDPGTFKIIQPPLTDALRGGGKKAVTKEPRIAKTKPKPSQPQFRTWTSSSGKFSVDALLIRIKNGVAHLKKKDGKVIQVPLTKLSPADRKFVTQRNQRD